VRRVVGEGFQFSNYAFEFCDEAVGTIAEDVEDGAVVPQCAIAASGEALEDGLAVETVVGEDGRTLCSLSAAETRRMSSSARRRISR
jgi:hypothetical protein